MNSTTERAATSEWAGLEQSHLYNEDLAPVPPSRRKWGLLNFAALWISMSSLLPRVVRHARREHPGAFARSWRAVGSASRPRLAAARLAKSSV